MSESMRSRIRRFVFNLFPAYRGSGGRITYLSDDWKEMRVELPLSWRTRNYVGTIYGGSIYASVDPMYMIMLIQTLGRDYVVWDKAASIRFRKPGRTTLHARFLLTDQELDAIRAEAAVQPSLDRVYRVELVDAEGVLHAEVEKTIYIRRKDAERRAKPASSG